MAVGEVLCVMGLENGLENLRRGRRKKKKKRVFSGLEKLKLI